MISLTLGMNVGPNDLYVPLTENFDMEIPYEKAQEIILEALKPREDLASSINKVLGNIPGIEIDPSEYKDEDYFDPNQLFGGSEDDDQ